MASLPLHLELMSQSFPKRYHLIRNWNSKSQLFVKL